MEMKNHLVNMANYHKWAYKRLLFQLDELDNVKYYHDYGLFFKSIHKTLNHLYLVDIIWLSRFNKTNCNITSLDEELCSDRDELAKCLIKQADLWIEFVNKIDPLSGILHYTKMNGQAHQLDYLSAVAHVFNHGTHHRGQITSVISQLGHKIPELDFSYFLLESL